MDGYIMTATVTPNPDVNAGDCVLGSRSLRFWLSTLKLVFKLKLGTVFKIFWSSMDARSKCSKSGAF